MKRTTTILMVALMTMALLAGCGNESVRARNLKTGELQTFSAEGDVPDGYAICGSEECPVPEEVPCELLGAEVCQYQPSCRLKVLSCTVGGQTDPLPMGCMPPEAKESGAPADEAMGCLIPEQSESCEVTCVSRDHQLCEEIIDPQTCEARPECRYETAQCAQQCECMPGTDCMCAPCKPVGRCITIVQTCRDLHSQEACLSNQQCQWNDAPQPCLCSCPAGAECDCACPVDNTAGFCDEKIEPRLCEAQQYEGACLANPECEWGQFVCPPCVFDEPHNSSGEAPMACDCVLSCRTKQLECPPIPAVEFVCEGPDMQPLPLFDEMGCLYGWECIIQPECPAITMEMIVCEEGQQPVAVHDDKGCQIGWECVELPCPPMCAMYCENGFQTDDRGCAICSCK